MGCMESKIDPTVYTPQTVSNMKQVNILPSQNYDQNMPTPSAPPILYYNQQQPITSSAYTQNTIQYPQPYYTQQYYPEQNLIQYTKEYYYPQNINTRYTV